MKLEGVIAIKVKPNSSKNRIIGYENEYLVIEISAPAENNKANIELIKYLTKLTKQKVRIISGNSSKKKLIKIGI